MHHDTSNDRSAAVGSGSNIAHSNSELRLKSSNSVAASASILAARYTDVSCGAAALSSATQGSFGPAGIRHAAAGCGSNSGCGDGGIPLPPPSWGTLRIDRESTALDILSAAAGMASAADHSRACCEPSGRQVMMGESVSSARDSGIAGFPSPTQVISRSSHSMQGSASAIIPHSENFGNQNLGRSAEDRYP